MIKTIDNIKNNIKYKFEKLLGKENVLTSKEERIMYATDSTAVSTDLYLPDYILFPSSTEQVSEIMKIAYEKDISVTVRGAGTNMTGACVFCCRISQNSRPLPSGSMTSSRTRSGIHSSRRNAACWIEAAQWTK